MKHRSIGKDSDVRPLTRNRRLSQRNNIVPFRYFLPEGATDPILRIYNLIGELVVEEDLPAGGTTFDWDLRTAGGTALPNGLYLCVVTVTGANPSEIFRLLIVR